MLFKGNWKMDRDTYVSKGHKSGHFAQEEPLARDSIDGESRDERQGNLRIANFIAISAEYFCRTD
jgi:hypothetical protein